MRIRGDYFRDYTECGPEVALRLWTDPSTYPIRSGMRPGYILVSPTFSDSTHTFDYTPSSRSAFRNWLEHTFDVVSRDESQHHEVLLYNNMRHLHFPETGSRYPEPAPQTRVFDPRQVQEILKGRRRFSNSSIKLKEPSTPVGIHPRNSSSELEQTGSWIITDMVDPLSERASDDNFSIISNEDEENVEDS